MNETPLQCLNRLVSALSLLSAEEDCLLRGGDYGSATRVQARQEPVIAKLVELAADPHLAKHLKSIWLKRIQPLVAMRQAHGEILMVRMTEVKARLRMLDETQSRLKRVRPAYRSAVRRPSFLAAG